MKVIITFTFCCDNLWKSKFMALEKPGKPGNFFLLLYGHLAGVIPEKSGPAKQNQVYASICKSCLRKRCIFCLKLHCWYCVDGPPHADDAGGDLHAEVQQLRSDLENFRSAHEKQLANLTAELDEEKKIRRTLQVEIERLTKRLAD